MDCINKEVKSYYTTVLSQMFSPDGNFLVAGTSYGEIFVFDIQTIIDPDKQISDSKQKSCFKFTAFENGQICSMSSTEKFLIVGSYGKIIGFEWKYITHSKVPKVAWSLNIPHTNDAVEVVEVNALVVTPSKKVFSGCGDNKIHVYSLEDGKLVQSLSAHKNYIHDLAYMSEEQVASAGEDGYVYIWDCRTAKPVSSLEPHKETTLQRPNLGKWVGCVSVEKEWLACGGGPKPGLWHIGTMQLTTSFDAINKEVHICQIHEEKVMIGTGNRLSQYTLQGDPICSIPSSSCNIYSLLIQKEPHNVMVFAGSSPDIDFCTNFHYRDQILSCRL